MRESDNNVDRWRRAESAFSDAIELPEAERDAFVARACADDEIVLAEVRSLLGCSGGAKDRVKGVVMSALTKLHALPGTRIGGYILDRLCARGGFASVYQATSIADGSLAAVKVLHPHLSTPKYLRRFDAEVQIVNLLRHPNIVVVHEAGEVSTGRPYFAMEWLAGPTLGEEIRARGPLSVVEVLPIFEELADALSAAHQRDIVHRDLKSSNVMLIPHAGRQQVKLVDFGVAKLLDAEQAAAANASGLTSANVIIGTPLYMAPEQFRGRPVDPRTDLYALGVLLFEALTGRYPFEGDREIVREMHLHARPPLARDFAPVSAAVDAVIQRCLEKQPSERYASAVDVIEALRAAISAGGSVRRANAAIGLCIELEIRCDDDQIDGELFDEIERRLERSLEVCTAAGLAISLRSTNLILATAPLPAFGDELRRFEVARVALDLGDELWNRHADRRLRTKVSLHVADGTEAGRTPGELLAIDRWAAEHPGDAVLATESACVGLEDRFATSEVGSAESRIWILRAV